MNRKMTFCADNAKPSSVTSLVMASGNVRKVLTVLFIMLTVIASVRGNSDQCTAWQTLVEVTDEPVLICSFVPNAARFWWNFAVMGSSSAYWTQDCGAFSGSHTIILPSRCDQNCQQQLSIGTFDCLDPMDIETALTYSASQNLKVVFPMDAWAWAYQGRLNTSAFNTAPNPCYYNTSSGDVNVCHNVGPSVLGDIAQFGCLMAAAAALGIYSSSPKRHNKKKKKVNAKTKPVPKVGELSRVGDAVYIVTYAPTVKDSWEDWYCETVTPLMVTIRSEVVGTSMPIRQQEITAMAPLVVDRSEVVNIDRPHANRGKVDVQACSAFSCKPKQATYIVAMRAVPKFIAAGHMDKKAVTILSPFFKLTRVKRVNANTVLNARQLHHLFTPQDLAPYGDHVTLISDNIPLMMREHLEGRAE